MKKLLNAKNVILTILAFVLIVSVVFTFIIVKSDYSFKLKFNDEELNFFDGETLYYSDAVNINFEGDGYITRINNKKFKNDITLEKDGKYTLTLHKLLKKYSIAIEVNSNPEVYLVDSAGNEIHNYLSNSNPFKIVRNSDDINIYINNMVYSEESMVEEEGNYIVSTDDDSYTVNILEINK